MIPNIKKIANDASSRMERYLTDDAEDPAYCSWEIVIRYRDASDQDTITFIRKHAGVFADGERIELE